MLTASSLILQNEFVSEVGLESSLAHNLFEESRRRAQLAAFKRILGLGRSLAVLSEALHARESSKTGAASIQHSVGTRPVAVRQIVGSELRMRDFDRSFNPRSDRIRHRWVKIAECFLNQTPLPAVELIQLGDEYYVRDGHHRVSVARSLGIEYIEANLVVLA